MFDQFPKIRPELPEKHASLYRTYYKSNREGNSPASLLSQKVESWLHRQVAKDLLNIDGDNGEQATLEIGAGTLNQLKFEPEVGVYDIVEPFTELFAGSKLLCRIRKVYSDISEVPADIRYNRITSIATFEHICNLPVLVAKCGMLLKDNGTLRVSIPSEGLPIWTLGWKLTTGLEYRLKYGLDYGDFLKHEHVNDAREIEDVLRFFFKEIDSSYLGLCKFLSLYQFYACSHPDIGRCSRYLDGLKL